MRLRSGQRRNQLQGLSLEVKAFMKSTSAKALASDLLIFSNPPVNIMLLLLSLPVLFVFLKLFILRIDINDWIISEFFWLEKK